jgi:hypothetical protein
MSRPLSMLAVALLGHVFPALADSGPDLRTQWHNTLSWPASCEDDWESAPAGSGITQYSLPDGRRLIGVSCSSAAQGYQLYYLQSAEGVASGPLRFPVYEDAATTARARLVRQWNTELQGQSRYDEKTGELRVLRLKGRNADCGTWASYGFDPTGPVLLELRAKLECDGRDAQAPQRWQRQLVPH